AASEHHVPAYEISPPRAPHAARTDLETFLEELEQRFSDALPETVATGGEGERAIIVAVGTGTKEDLDRSLAELEELARSTAARSAGGSSTSRRSSPGSSASAP